MSASDHGSITLDGYRLVYLPNHPLRNRWGTVPEHRAVLYDAIGPGEHPCHWCGRTLEWDTNRVAFRVNADHVDGNRLNNVIENLVPACMDCNTRRGVNEPWLKALAARLADIDAAPPADLLLILCDSMEHGGFGRNSLLAFEARAVATEVSRIRRLRTATTTDNRGEQA